MRIPPKFTITEEIITLITDIKAHLLLFNSLKIPLPLQRKITKVSVLKSSLFSARIEGNPLTTENFDYSEQEQSKVEIFNILDAQEYIQKSVFINTELSTEFIETIHKLTMMNLRTDAGHIRKEQNAVFNSNGAVVYMPPPPSQVNPLLEKLCDYINSSTSFPIITAFVAHLIFEKIHPFIDGNGRVGRLLIPSILKSKGYEMPFVVPFEEYLDNHKAQYYYVLDIGFKNTDEYLRFMMKAFVEQLKSMRIFIEDEMKKKETLLLPPRQEEIYFLIKEQEMISLDMLKRRFLKVPDRTLRYDLEQLQKKGHIIKVGKTKGSYYKIRHI